MARLDDSGLFVASWHAVDQSLDRVPVLRGATRAAAVRWVERTAGRALRDGRRSKTMPRWCVRNGSAGRSKLTRRKHGEMLFLWDESETFVFVVAKSRKDTNPDEAEPAWIVCSVVSTSGRVNPRPEGAEGVRWRPTRS